MRGLITLILMLTASAIAQAQLSSSQKLYYLCKVWGYLKYHHPNNCAVKWNNLLLSRVDSVVASAGNSDFNSILYHMCLQTGVTSPPALPTIIPGDTPKTYHTAWFHDAALSRNVQDFLDSVQAHRISNTSGCMLTVNNYSDPSYNSYIDFRKDSIRNIPAFSYANLNHRMLVYFYYWNTINYFFPQIDIADQHWDSTLVQLMPDMIAATSDSAFETTLARVVSRIDDSHGSYTSRYYYKYLSDVDITKQTVYRSKLVIARVQNKHIVRASAEPDIHMGDIITKIDGIDADTFFARWKPYFAASNEVTKYRNMYRVMQFGDYDAVRRLELVDATSTIRQVDLHATTSFAQYTAWYTAAVDTLPEWGFTKCGYGYVNMGKLRQASVMTMYNSLKPLPAIIFDIRNYPQGTLWNLKPLLFPNPQISARYFTPDLSYPGYYFTEDDLNNFGSWNNNVPYTGRVIILVNEETQSQAEYTAQALRTFPRATIIGSQSAGADGNIAYLDLPNDIRTYWSSLGWYQADWYNPQRAGVRVDSIVHPTIAGIRSGSDEVLAKAFDCKLAVPQPDAEPAFSLLQQPRQLMVMSTGNAAFSIVLVNTLGQAVYRSADHLRQAIVPTGHLPPGIYAVTILDKNHAGKRSQILIR